MDGVLARPDPRRRLPVLDVAIRSASWEAPEEETWHQSPAWKAALASSMAMWRVWEQMRVEYSQPVDAHVVLCSIMSKPKNLG